MPLGERRRLSVVDRRRPLGIPLIERRSCRVPPRGGFRYSAQWAEGDLSVVDRQRVPFLLAQERNQRRARGAAPLRPTPPPIGLRPKSAAPCHGSADKPSASHRPPRRGRNASACESPKPYRKCARGGTAAFAWRAAPAGRRKTARLRRARAQSARTPGTGVVFRRASPASLPTAGLLGAAAPAFYPRLSGRERRGDSQGGRALRPVFFK